MQRTSIEWTDRSANPIRARNRLTGKVGWHCVKHGPGCLHCYAERRNKWIGTGLPFTQGASAEIDLFLEPKVLLALERLEEPQRVFLCDMTDLFMDRIPDDWIATIFDTMARTPHLTYQLLTKRGARMAGCEWAYSEYSRWPPNVWAGVSVEDRKHGLPRVEHLRRAPAALRFLSVEPLLEDLGPLDLAGIGWVIVGGESGPGARPRA
jgi:protein gp37